MSQITITIDTGGAAFGDDVPGFRPEVRRILRELAERVTSETGSDPLAVNDALDNGVCGFGYWATTTTSAGSSVHNMECRS